MTNYVKLTVGKMTVDNGSIYIRAENIVSIYDYRGHAILHIDGRTEDLIVVESVKEVLDKIEEVSNGQKESR